LQRISFQTIGKAALHINSEVADLFHCPIRVITKVWNPYYFGNFTVPGIEVIMFHHMRGREPTPTAESFFPVDPIDYSSSSAAGENFMDLQDFSWFNNPHHITDADRNRLYPGGIFSDVQGQDPSRVYPGGILPDFQGQDPGAGGNVFFGAPGPK
jgi:hypothetical protein